MKLSRGVALLAAVALSGIVLQTEKAYTANCEESFDKAFSFVEYINGKNSYTDCYNYFTSACDNISKLESDKEVSRQMSDDETSAGLFAFFKSEEESSLRLVKSVYEFNQTHS